MSHLPIEIVHKIINYTGVVTFYKGKYYNKISREDPRYIMLSRVLHIPYYCVRHNGLTNNSYQVVVNLKPNIGESYAGVRFKLVYYCFKNNAGETVRQILELFRCGREKSYSNYYVWSMEQCWMKICATSLS